MKTTKMLTILVLVMGLMVCLTGVSKAEEPMGTAWTYQGRLMDANETADGEYDFQFKLYDARVGGSKPANDVNVGGVDVIDGYFTVELEFGSDVFDGNARWLEIDVRPDDSNDVNDFVTLSPRQEVTPTPYAIYAQTSGTTHSLGAIQGNMNITGDITSDGTINALGFGAGNSTYRGDGWIRVYHNEPHNPTNDFVFKSGGGTPGPNPTLGEELMRLTGWQGGAGGNLGIGTASPTVKLDVNGDGYFRGGNLFVASPIQTARTYEIRTGVRQEIYNRNDFIHFSGSNVAFVLNSDEFGGGGNDEFFIAEGNTGTGNIKFILEGTSGNVGIGTVSPEDKLDVRGGILFRSSDTILAGNLHTMVSDEPNDYDEELVICLGVSADDRSSIFIGPNPSGSLAPKGRVQINAKKLLIYHANVGIGTTTPAGKLDVNGSIYQRGGLLHADYVFEPGYELESIDEHSEFMWQNKHLSAIPKAKVDEAGKQIIEVGAHRRGIVEELEKAHIYIEQLHTSNKALEARLAELESIIAELSGCQKGGL